MSWLFGLNKTGADPPLQVPVLGDDEVSGGGGGGGGGGDGGNGGNTGNGGNGSNGGNGGYRSEAYSFDSTALERAARAAKASIS